jgi:hypothetical protein
MSTGVSFLVGDRYMTPMMCRSDRPSTPPLSAVWTTTLQEPDGQAREGLPDRAWMTPVCRAHEARPRHTGGSCQFFE